jgi:hypothetical protein
MFLAMLLVSPLTADDETPAWVAKAISKPPMNADETRAFIRRLATYVEEHHLKKAAASPQRGMLYEYFDTTRAGELDQFIQGEALDTMHDGAWYGAAMVNAYRATGDKRYLDFLRKWQLPFYLKMLNHSDELFKDTESDARAGVKPFDKEHALIPGEKGFVPYFWDDGGSVSLERRQDKKPGGVFPCVDHLAGKENPKFLLDGYSLGSSNHLAQDLGIFLQLSWLALRDADDAKNQLAEVEAAIKNLHESRLRHHGTIPMVFAPVALVSGKESDRQRLPGADGKLPWRLDNHYRQAVVHPEPGKRRATPGFADNQQYLYYYSLVRGQGELPKPIAFRLIYDTYTEPMLWQIYCGDDYPAGSLPGMNRFDLYGLNFIDGRPEHTATEKKGPFNRPVPLGSRMGPQNMVMCGISLQLLKQHPGLWREGVLENSKAEPPDRALDAKEEQVQAWLERELGHGLRTWEAVFDHYGYIPTSIGRGPDWDKLSDTGGYAHLISAASQWLLCLEGKRDWEVHKLQQK